LLNIALCDDMPVLRGILEMLIHEYEAENNIKFNIYHFDSGEDLLEKFDENKTFFNIFFLDYYMKELTGLETALHIRRHDKKCGIVFVTSSIKRNELMTVNPLRILSKSPKKEEIFDILDGMISPGSESV